MSKILEPKRINLTTLSSGVSADIAGTSAAAASRFCNDFLAPLPDKAICSGSDHKSAQKAIRLELELFQTDSCSYPEFNYSKLLHLEKKKFKKLKQKSNGFADQPLEENNDDEIARIAKDLEKKYGTAYGRARGSSKKDDHCDIGHGYDESDSFIDNTEAYDEVIPEEVETIEGGFYINCGALEFKKLYESTTTKTDELIKMPNRPKKRILSSSSSSGEESETDENDDGDKNNNDPGHDASEPGGKTKKLKNTNGPPVEKRLKSSAANKLKAQNGSRKSTATSADKHSSNPCSSSNSPKPSLDVDIGGSESDKDRMRQQKSVVVKTTTVKDMLKAKRDSFLKMQVGGNEVKGIVNGEVRGAATKSSDDESSSEDSDDSSDGSDSNESETATDSNIKKTTTTTTSPGATAEENSEKRRTVDTKLPVLDVEVHDSIIAFMEGVKCRSMTGKKFQFDDKFTEEFLKIDDSLLCIEKPQRNMVFAHLEYQLMLPKYYFLRKAKQLRIKEEKLKSKRALNKLRKAVIEAMPEAIQRYEVELQKLTTSGENQADRKKLPKKKFTWTSVLRNLLYDVYQVRWTSFLVLGTRKETLEDFITVYMRKKVVELWPNGWMRYDELQREIEKRKTAAKKAKEKKKAENTYVIMANTAVNVASSSATTAPAAAAVHVANAYMKQLEELNAISSRCIPNSDTDAIQKRKVNDTNIRQSSKNTGSSTSKVQKSNSDQQQQQQLSAANAVAAIPVGLLSPSKRTDHSIHSIIAQSIFQISTPSSNPLLSNAFTDTPNQGQLLQQQQQQKHSTVLSTETVPAVPMAKPAHIIDLDNYKCTNDILQTSKLIAAQTNAAKMEQHLSVRESSSESDGVEIVEIFPTNLTPSKPKYRKVNNISNAKQCDVVSAVKELESVHQEWKLQSKMNVSPPPPPKELSKQ